MHTQLIYHIPGVFFKYEDFPCGLCGLFPEAGTSRPGYTSLRDEMSGAMVME